MDIVTTPFSKYYILTNRPSLLHPEDPSSAQAPTPEPALASPAPAPASAHPTLTLHNIPLSASTAAASHRSRAGGGVGGVAQQHSAVRRRPTSSRTGPAGAATLMAAPASSPHAPPRTQAQEINDEIQRLKAELVKGPLGVPIDPDGTPCLEVNTLWGKGGGGERRGGRKG